MGFTSDWKLASYDGFLVLDLTKPLMVQSEVGSYAMVDERNHTRMHESEAWLLVKERK